MPRAKEWDRGIKVGALASLEPDHNCIQADSGTFSTSTFCSAFGASYGFCAQTRLAFW